MCDKCQTLHDGSAYRALLFRTTFSDLDPISRSQQCKTDLTANCMFLIDELFQNRNQIFLVTPSITTKPTPESYG